MIKPIQSIPGTIATQLGRQIPVLVLLSIGSFAALISGGTFLEASLFGGLPVGNALAAAALCLSACIAIGLSRSRTIGRYLSVTALVTAFAWLPASIILAGNLTLNFSGTRGQVWVWLSMTTIVVILIALIWATVDYLVKRRALKKSVKGEQEC